RSQKTRGRFLNRQCAHLHLKLPLVAELGGAVLAAGDVLLQLMPRVISELVVQIKGDVLSNPFAIHRSNLSLSSSRGCREAVPLLRDSIRLGTSPAKGGAKIFRLSRSSFSRYKFHLRDSKPPPMLSTRPP